MPHLDNFSAWITVDNKKAKEYGVEYSDDGLSVSCYIASEVGKNFTIWWRDFVRADNSMGRTYVDGKRCGIAKGINKRGYKSNLGANERDTACQNGVAISSTQVRPLVFSELSLTDEEPSINIVGGMQPESELGVIKLEVSYVRRGDHAHLKVIPFEPYGKVNERSRKGLPAQHQTILGSPIAKEFIPVFSVQAYGPPQFFIFKYRPLNVLRYMGVVPRRLVAVIDLSEDPNEEAKVLHGSTVHNDEIPAKGEDEYIPCEFEERAMLVDEKIFIQETLSQDYDPDSKALVKKEVEDNKAFLQPKMEPELANVKVKAEPGVKVEIKTEDGSYLRVKKEEEQEVRKLLVTKAE